MSNLLQKRRETGKSFSSPSSNKGKLIGSDYTSVVDYESLGIAEDDRSFLVDCEKNISQNAKTVFEGKLNIARSLYEAREKLASYDGGTFVSWFTALGMKKDAVYTYIDRYKLLLKYKEKSIADISVPLMNIPVRSVRELKKMEDILPDNDVFTIIESENPTQEIKRFKETMFSDCQKTKISVSDRIQEAEIVYDNEEKEAAKIRITEIDAELQELERRREHLKFERDMLSKRI